MGCRFLLQCMKVKSESEVAQLCPTQRPHGLQPTRLLPALLIPFLCPHVIFKLVLAFQPPFSGLQDSIFHLSLCPLNHRHAFSLQPLLASRLYFLLPWACHSASLADLAALPGVLLTACLSHWAVDTPSMLGPSNPLFSFIPQPINKHALSFY